MLHKSALDQAIKIGLSYSLFDCMNFKSDY